MTYGWLLIVALVAIHAVGRYFMFKAEEKYEDELKKYIDDAVKSKVENKDKEKDDGREDN